MINSVIAIFAGLVLLGSSLRSIPSVGLGLEKFARWLSLFDVAIGVVAIVIGILELLSLEGILLIMAGFVLAISALQSIPSIGEPLARVGNALIPFRLLIGAVILIVGVLNVLSALFGSFRF